MATRMLITADVRGAGRLNTFVADFSRKQRGVQDNINRTMRQMARDLEPVYATYAPVDTTELKRSIDTRVSFRAARVRITVTADASRDGFNYLAVTRFGHVKTFITPRRRKAMKVYVHGRFATPIRRHMVRGYRPRVDWVEVATRHASHIYERHERDLRRQITRTVTT
jgi:hypothetical protein